MTTILPTNLVIHAKYLAQNVNLVFTFTRLVGDMTSVIWRAANFQADTNSIFPLAYLPKFRFIEPEVTDNRITGGGAMVHIEIGQLTTYTGPGSTGPGHFSTPVSGVPGIVAVINNGPNAVDLALGFAPQLPGQTNVALSFTAEPSIPHPITWTNTLYAYAFVDGDYQADDIVSVTEAVPIWTQDLNTLHAESQWSLVAKGDNYQLVPGSP